MGAYESNQYIFKSAHRQRNKWVRVESLHINSRHTQKNCANRKLVKMHSLELCRIYYGQQHSGFCFRYFTVQHNTYQ